MAISASFAGSVSAATLTWDITPGTVGAGNSVINDGVGSWNLTATNGVWTTDDGVNNIAWTNGNDAIFSGIAASTITVGTDALTAGTITVNGTTETAYAGTLSNLSFTSLLVNTTAGGKLRINTTGLTGGTITVASGSTLYVPGAITVGSAISVSGTGNNENLGALRIDTGATLTNTVTLTGNTSVGGFSGTGTLSGIITGGFDLTKVGASTMVLSGANTYSGLTSVSAGTLLLRNNNNTATTGFSVASGATLRLGNAISLTSSQNITGAGNLGKDTGFFGDSTIAGTNNNYTGATTVEVSRLTLAAGGVISGTSSVTISAVNNAALTNNGSITTPGAFTITGGNATSGIFTNTSTGVLNSSSMSLAAGSTTNNSGTINNSGAFSSNGTFTSAGTLTTGAVTVGGTFTLGAASSFTNSAGSMIINSGGLVSLANAAHLSSIAPNGITINTGGAFATSPAFPTVNSVLATGKILNTSAGAISLSGNSSENIDFTGFSALGLAGSGNAIFSGTITPAGGVYRFGGSAASNLTVASALSGSNAVVQSGLGITTLTAANTYSGTTTVSAGNLVIGSAGSINGSAVTVSGGKLSLTGGAAITGGSTTVSGGTLSLTGSVSITGSNTTVSSGLLTLEGNSSINGGAVLVSGGTLTVGGSATLNATSGGTVTTTGGSLATYSLNAIGAAGSTIALNNSSGTLGVVFGGSANETTDRVISHLLGGAFTNSGTGTLTFTNNFLVPNTAIGITFTGGGRTVMQGVTGATALLNFNKAGVGTLIVNGAIRPNGGNIRAQGGVLSFSPTATTTGNAIIAGQRTVGGIIQFASGSSIKTATDTNTNGILGGWATFNNTTFAKINGAGLAIDGLADASYIADAWAVGNNTDVSLAGADPATGSTTNSLRFNAAGAKTLTLAGTNLVTSGGLLVTSAVGANTTIITGGTITAGALNASTDLILHQHNTAGELAIASAIANNGTGTTSVTKAGPGTVNFSTQKSYTGTTNVLEGVLNLSFGGGSAGVIRGTANVAAGATLRLSTGDATGFTAGATALTTINLLGGNLDVNTTLNQTLGSAVINMTGGSITGVATSNIDFFGGASALNTLATGTTSTIAGVTISPLRQGSTTFTVAQGYTPSGIDLDIQGVIRTPPTASGPNATNAVFIKAGNGTMALSGTNTISNTATNSIRIDAGTLMVGNGGTTGNLGGNTGGFLPVVNNAVLAFNRSDAAGSFANVISGTGELRQVGSGTTTLTAANSYTGVTTVSAGTLLASATSSMAGTSSITILPGATFVGGGTNIFVGGHGTALANSKIITVNGGTLLFNANMDSRFGNVTLNGGTWTSNRPLSGFDALLANTTTGPATVLVTGTAPSTMNGTGGIHLQGVQNFDVADVTGSSANDLSVSLILAGPGSIGGAAGGINKLGPGIMELSAVNTYNGTTTVTAGTLAVTGSLANNGPASIFVAAPDSIQDANDPKITRRVPNGTSYTLGSLTGQGSTAVSNDLVLMAPMTTTASILAGTASGQADVSMQWRARTPGEANPANPNAVLSNVLNLEGISDDPLTAVGILDTFVLQMSYTDAALNALGLNENSIATSGELRLGWNDNGVWKTANLGNNNGSGTGPGGFVGAFAYNPSFDVLGNYGVDPASNVVWAVLNHNSEFAVIPEPSTLVLGGVALLGLAGVGLRRRRLAKQC